MSASLVIIHANFTLNLLQTVNIYQILLYILYLNQLYMIKRFQMKLHIRYDFTKIYLFQNRTARSENYKYSPSHL